jgi:alkyldihydroxyacetonephosphate synthase
MMKNGGSVSHHHGIGKIRKRFTENTLPPMAIDVLKGIKSDMDPNNVFATNNTYYKNEAERKKDLGE